ncbi:MAG: hypothetical protein LUE93_09180 [Bacteroides sp.]|nr:hypothetical protein [Bacteroides sp.]
MNVPDARVWDLETPELYTCEIQLKSRNQLIDKE